MKKDNDLLEKFSSIILTICTLFRMIVGVGDFFDFFHLIGSGIKWVCQRIHDRRKG